MDVDWARFVYKDPARNSNKYWMYYTSPMDGWVLYRWGRTNTRGQFKLDTSSDAYFDLMTKQSEKLNKGYYLDNRGTKQCDPKLIRDAVRSGDVHQLHRAINTVWNQDPPQTDQTYFFEEITR